MVKKGTNKKKSDGICNNIEKIESKQICIKPVHLYDLRLIYSSSNKLKENAKCKQKRKYESREQICPHCGKMTKTLNSHILQHIGLYLLPYILPFVFARIARAPKKV